jgi:hypothetical protein
MPLFPSTYFHTAKKKKTLLRHECLTERAKKNNQFLKGNKKINMQWNSHRTKNKKAVCASSTKDRTKLLTVNYCTADILPRKFEEGYCPPAQGKATKGLVPMTSPRGSTIRSSTSLYNKKKFWEL